MNIYKTSLRKLKNDALLLRQKTFLSFIEMGEAHLGGSFSMIEILLALYRCILKKNDTFILSKAHSSVPFCIMLRDYGYKPEITTHLEIDKKNGIECTTGSLGHGLPISVGMALAKKKKKNKSKVFVLISDGECQEGTTWESLLIASSLKLNNLIIIVDYNKIQALDYIDNVLPLDNLKKKFEAFNCETYEIKNGHSFYSILNKFKNIKINKKPIVVILHTTKGKGIEKFENDPSWHAKKIRNKEELIGKKSLGIL
tara:strand:+ start:561 stop:1328 length:768 start_codon:yes stop_codon:yes gene_type:complete